MAAIQFNLLPNVKLQYVKTQKIKRLLFTISVIVSLGALFVLLLSFVSVDVVQKKSLRDLDSDIAKYGTQLKNVKDLNKILTVQNQLGTLTTLHDSKPVSSRLFNFISEVTPVQASLSQLTLDFSGGTLVIGGEAPSLDTVSTYTDTLKATMYTVAGTSSGPKHAFSEVVLTNFGRDQKGASFVITTNFDQTIFKSSGDVSLTVPGASTVDPASVFGTGK